ncbi:hypothetical protein ACI2L1_24840 [Streptomyces sp. NPDC019531]|uniref:hypothetical protein n=1 Tax=Streptomyces sp. NPDC019531 TaxID=3365062 RepID=UPI00384D7C0E
MSEDQSAGHSHVVRPDPVRDVYLMTILAMLDEDSSNKSAVSVTLQVGGALVTGELIGHGRWQDEFKAWLATIGGSSDVLATVFDAIDQERAGHDQDDPNQFLHLRNAKFITNYLGSMEGITPQGPERPLWRTRIAEVQGWSLGRPQ